MDNPSTEANSNFFGYYKTVDGADLNIYMRNKNGWEDSGSLELTLGNQVRRVDFGQGYPSAELHIKKSDANWLDPILVSNNSEIWYINEALSGYGKENSFVGANSYTLLQNGSPEYTFAVELHRVSHDLEDQISTYPVESIITV